MIEISLSQKIQEITQFLQDKITQKPQIGLILGSGLGELVNSIQDKIVIPYTEIPHLPRASAPGHAGNLILGKIGNKQFITMQGRFHLYEGHSPQNATILVRVMKNLGVNTLFITCAAGSLNREYNAGDIMLITDHFSLFGASPLTGANLDEFGPRFPGMFDIYTENLQKIAIEVATKEQIRLNKGVYGLISGPAYATRTELQALINNGCDAVGMSVTHEATVAAHANMQILGLAALTDMALPYANHHANENEVIEMGKKISIKFKTLIMGIINHI
jgi:purine-nucleoside phosphorylase